MVAPVYAREGARISATSTSFSVSCRTDSNGVNLDVEVARDPGFAFTVGSVTTGALNAGNNYCATAYVSGLNAGTKYYWRLSANDGSGGVTYGADALTSGEFKTIATEPIPQRLLFGGCYYGQQMGDTASKSRRTRSIFAAMLALNPDRFFPIGDVYYPDVGGTRGAAISEPADDGQAWVDDATSAYKQNAWYLQVRGTDDGTVPRFRTNLITTLDGNVHLASGPSLGHVMAKVPTYPMWDDHDRCYNEVADLDGSEVALGTGDANKRDNAHQVWLEYYGDLTRDLINADATSAGAARSYATDCVADSVSPEMRFVVDIPPVRYIVLDREEDRNHNSSADSPSHSTWGAEQNAWIRARIDDNQQPFLVIVSPVAFDGDHGIWLEPLAQADGMKGYSYERDNLLDYIWANGCPERTAILSFDTHNGFMAKYEGPNAVRTPIYEFMASQGLWTGSSHLYMTGFAQTAWRTGETIAASGNGAELMLMRTKQNNGIMIDSGPGYMTISLVEYESDGTAGLIVESKTYR